MFCPDVRLGLSGANAEKQVALQVEKIGLNLIKG